LRSSWDKYLLKTQIQNLSQARVLCSWEVYLESMYTIPDKSSKENAFL
jgi:hypothetical protein